MYGDGPDGNPELYDSLGVSCSRRPTLEDLQRDTAGKAFLVESRNDENLVIAPVSYRFPEVPQLLHRQGRRFRRRRSWCDGIGSGSSYTSSSRKSSAGQVDRFLTSTGGQAEVPGRLFQTQAEQPDDADRILGGAYRSGIPWSGSRYVMADRKHYEDASLQRRRQRPSRLPPIRRNLRSTFANFFDIPGIPTPPGRNISRKMDARSRQVSITSHRSGHTSRCAGRHIAPRAQPSAHARAWDSRPSGCGANDGHRSTYQRGARLDRRPRLAKPKPLVVRILKKRSSPRRGQAGPRGAHRRRSVLGLIDADKDSYFSSPQAWDTCGRQLRLLRICSSGAAR